MLSKFAAEWACSVDVKVWIEHEKLKWALSLGFYRYLLCAAVRSQCWEQAQGHCAKRRLQHGKVGSWKVLQSGWQEPQGGGNVGGPRGGLSGMQNKEVVGRGRALNCCYACKHVVTPLSCAPTKQLKILKVLQMDSTPRPQVLNLNVMLLLMYLELSACLKLSVCLSVFWMGMLTDRQHQMSGKQMCVGSYQLLIGNNWQCLSVLKATSLSSLEYIVLLISKQQNGFLSKYLMPCE